MSDAHGAVRRFVQMEAVAALHFEASENLLGENLAERGANRADFQSCRGPKYNGSYNCLEARNNAMRVAALRSRTSPGYTGLRYALKALRWPLPESALAGGRGFVCRQLQAELVDRLSRSLL